MEAFTHNSKRWRELSKRVLRKYKYNCQYNARYGKSVHADCVHHIFPVDEYPEYAYCLWNLIPLSDKAHESMHDRLTGRLTALGREIMRRTEPKRQAYERSKLLRRQAPPP